jgi:hypothetical protein
MEGGEMVGCVGYRDRGGNGEWRTGYGVTNRFGSMHIFHLGFRGNIVHI